MTDTLTVGLNVSRFFEEHLSSSSFRVDLNLPGTSSVSTATQVPEGCNVLSSANDGQAVGRRAYEVLKEMGRLKCEMQTLLTVSNTVDLSRIVTNRSRLFICIIPNHSIS